MTVEPAYPIDTDEDIDLYSFERHNWKTTPARDFWRPLLRTCADAYERVEVAAVKLETSPRKVVMYDRGRQLDQSFVNYLAGEGLVTEQVHDTVFAADGIADASAAADAYRDDDHETLGELLGYPECCVEHFDPDEETQAFYERACRTDHAKAVAGDNETVLLEDAPPVLNTIWQYMGWQFISHTPCSFDCEESVEIARTHGQLYRQLGVGEEAERLWEFLATPTTWSGYNSIAWFRNGYLIGSTDCPNNFSEKLVKFRGEHADKLSPPV